VAQAVTETDTRMVRGAWAIVVGLVLLRLAASAWTPLTFDEAYYWTWSKHLAGGYYDHPPMVAMVIRLGTLIAGDTPLGVRLVSVLLTLPMSWAIYRAAELLFGGTRVAVTAMLLLNATMIVSVGLMIVTPDAPLLVASSFVLLALAQVAATGQGAWWLAVGVAVGCALLSKYTALFFGAAILIWLFAVPTMRRWLLSPWPYLGGIVAFAVFSPVLLWNADHQWVSFIKQLGRARIEQFRVSYIAELIPTQFAFATPLVFILGAMGLYALIRRPAGSLSSRVLVSAMVWVIALYFTWHALHARVEANWFAPVYPAFAIAAAVAATLVPWQARAQRTVDVCLRWATPVGAVMFVALVVQANTGVLSGYKRDATVRSVGVGFPALAAEIEAVRQRSGATCVLAPDYGTTSWLMFYMPKGTCVVQRGQRIRWINMPEPDAAQLAGKLLLVAPPGLLADPEWRDAFADATTVATLTRKRGPLVIEEVELDLLGRPTNEVLDRSPPPELEGR
jgi:4-amino-4-deoxy-L-arabinose transferase-like glycosyltransferase